MSVRNGIIALMFALVLVAPIGAGNAQARTVEETLSMIQALMAQIETLQKQLSTIQGEVKSLLREGLKEGMTDEDIGKLQELLATDPTIYPEGRVTKFFGPLTKEAVKRLQARHGLEITGVVDGETHELLEEYLKEGFGDKIPPGLLRAPGIAKKVELRYSLGCEAKGHGMGPLCKKYHGDDHDEDEEEEEDEHFNIEIEIEDGEATVEFTFEDEDYEVTADSTDEDEVLEAVADELGEEVEDLDDHLVTDIKDALEAALEDLAGEFDVEVEIEDGETAVTFTFDDEDYDVDVESDNLSDVLEAVADELDEDVDDLDENLVDAITEAFEDAEDAAEEELSEDAEDAISDAEDAIDVAEEEIEDAEGDTTAADALLDEAYDLFTDAEEAFEDEEYEDAVEFADDAKAKAEAAVDAL